jgi:membrane glycosyltransferase
VGLGRALRRARLFVIPEEAEPPPELRTVRARIAGAGEGPRFVDAVVDPATNATMCAVLPPRTKLSARAHSSRARAIAVAVKDGPNALTDQQKLFFLTDPVALSQLHVQVSTSPAAHPSWFSARAEGAFSQVS